MRVVVINSSGNTGKSTLAANLLKPRMGDAKIFSIETVCIDAAVYGVDVVRLDGNSLSSLLAQIEVENAIVDVGSSNTEQFLNKLLQDEEAQRKFDFFVVPVVSGYKQQMDSMITTHMLAKAGVPPSKIRVVFNLVEPDDDLEHDFKYLFDIASSSKSFVMNPKVAVYRSEVFKHLSVVKKTLHDFSVDKTDYREQYRANLKQGGKDLQLQGMFFAQGLSNYVDINMDTAFAALLS